MALPYLSIKIGDNEATVTDANKLPVSLDYSLESRQNFQEKTSATSLGLTLPATLANQKTANNYDNPAAVDLTAGQKYRSALPVVIESGGDELLIGKAILDDASKTDYTYNCYGDNANWAIDLQDTTLYDLLQGKSFIFTTQLVRNSWAFDGTDENLYYVFAPVRYGSPPGGYRALPNNERMAVLDNYLTEYMRPALSKYFLLYWMFKQAGYRIVSTFMTLAYFRRQTLPWTWGNFLQSDGTRLDVHKFVAKSTSDKYFTVSSGAQGQDIFVNLDVSNDSTLGGFDNAGTPGDYVHDSVNYEMIWTYNAPDFGLLNATFSIQIFYDYSVGGNNSQISVRVYWYKIDGVTGVKTQVQVDLLLNESGPLINTSNNNGTGITSFFLVNIPVRMGDKITAKVRRYMYESKQVGHNASLTLNVIEFKLDYFRIPLGGTIAFDNYPAFKNYKALDLFRGVIDEFNFSLNTDPVTKTVYIEPTHEYEINGVKYPGYFNGDYIEWDGKEDDPERFRMQNYRDYERQVTFRYQNDSSDGILQIITKRNSNIPAAAKYVFPERFKVGKKEIENRFFGPVIHYFADEFKSLTSTAPQLIVIAQESISDTSSSEAATFIPKSAYYAGLRTGFGAWRFENIVEAALPTMFAVNYKPGGENDPVLSYCDELIGDKDLFGGIIINGQLINQFLKFNNQNSLVTGFYIGQQLTLSAIGSQGGTYTVVSVSTVVNNQFSVELNHTFTTQTITSGIFSSPGNKVVAKGLLKKFYWQRLAIMRNGQYYDTFFRLNNKDVARQLFREHRIYDGQKWQCMAITGYNPLLQQAVAVLLYKHHPVEQADADNTFPTVGSVLNDMVAPGFDVKYSRLLGLSTDIPG